MEHTEDPAELEVWALPELIQRGDGREWHVLPPEDERYQCATDLANNIMWAPTDPTDQGRGRRFHELAHVAISPSPGARKRFYKAGEVGEDALQAAEDARINQFLGRILSARHRARISDDENMTKVGSMMGVRGPDALRSAALTAVSSYGTPDFEPFIEGYKSGLKRNPKFSGMADQVANFVHVVAGGAYGYVNHADTTFAHTVNAARYIDHMLDPVTGERPDSVAMSMPVPIPVRSLSGKDTEVGKEFAEKMKPSEKGDSADELSKKLEDFLEYHNQGGKWGRMEIVRESLTKSHPSRHVARKVRPKDFGDSVRFMDRDEADGKVFGAMRRTKGGTILIDESGSMHFDSEQMARIIAAAPGALIASYSGRGGEGRLRIIGEHGKSVEDGQVFQGLGGNIIDGPALEWLATQRRPRLWVSDGKVTGVGDNPPLDLKIEANLICMKNHITRVPHADEAVEFLKKGRFR